MNEMIANHQGTPSHHPSGPYYAQVSMEPGIQMNSHNDFPALQHHHQQHRHSMGDAQVIPGVHHQLEVENESLNESYGRDRPNNNDQHLHQNSVVQNQNVSKEQQDQRLGYSIAGSELRDVNMMSGLKEEEVKCKWR